MSVSSRWQSWLGTLLEWEYSTPQLVALLASAPVFWYVGTILNEVFPFVTVLVMVLYIGSVPLGLRVPANRWKVARALAHAFFIFWIVAWFFPVPQAYVPEVTPWFR